MHQIEIILKSGHVIPLTVKEFKLQGLTSEGYSSVSWSTVPGGPKLLGIVPSSIAAVVIVGSKDADDA